VNLFNIFTQELFDGFLVGRNIFYISYKIQNKWVFGVVGESGIHM
jgi:hypothetical protein